MDLKKIRFEKKISSIEDKLKSNAAGTFCGWDNHQEKNLRNVILKGCLH